MSHSLEQPAQTLGLATPSVGRKTPATDTARVSEPRIAIIQSGDFVAAERLIEAGHAETYFGMGRSVAAIHGLVRGHPHLIVSLDAPAYRDTRGNGLRVGLPLSRFTPMLPGTVPLVMRARAINRMLREFRPTHVLLRAGGLLGALVLGRCVRQGCGTLVILADYFSRNGRRAAWETDWFVRLLNDPSVFKVANHRRPAAQSAIECGVQAQKMVAYDFAPSRHPLDYPEKNLGDERPFRIVYVGNMLFGKGVADLIAATRLLARRRLPVSLTLAGSGPEIEPLRRTARDCPAGLVNFVGQVNNDQAFELMRKATLVCVPSHHNYPEGMPLTLTEALASRTPVVVSDHPVMKNAFADGEGVRFFAAQNAEALAQAIEWVVSDADAYRRLSHTTAAAYARVECKTLMPELIAQWEATF